MSEMIHGKKVEIVDEKGDKQTVTLRPLGISYFPKIAKISQFYQKNLDKTKLNGTEEEKSAEAIRVFCLAPQEVLIILAELVEASLAKAMPDKSKEQIDDIAGYNVNALMAIVMELNGSR